MNFSMTWELKKYFKLWNLKKYWKGIDDEWLNTLEHLTLWNVQWILKFLFLTSMARQILIAFENVLNN